VTDIPTTYKWKTVLSPPLNVPDEDIAFVAKRVKEEMERVIEALNSSLWGEVPRESNYPATPIEGYWGLGSAGK